MQLVNKRFTKKQSDEYAMKKILAEAFRNARNARGYTFQYLAQKLNVAPSLLHRIEQGQQMPSPWLVKRLEKLVNQPLAAMVHNNFDETPEPDNFLPDASAADWNWNTLNEEEQRYLLNLWQVTQRQLAEQRDVARAQLDKKQAKKKAQQPQLDQLTRQQQKMQEVLDFLQAGGATEDLVQFQQDLLAQTTHRLQHLELKTGNNKDLVAALLAINFLEWQRLHLVTKITAISPLPPEQSEPHYLPLAVEALPTPVQQFLTSLAYVTVNELTNDFKKAEQKLLQKARRFHLYAAVIAILTDQLDFAQRVLAGLATAPDDLKASQQAEVNRLMQQLAEAQQKQQQVSRVKLLQDQVKIEFLKGKQTLWQEVFEELEK